MLIIKKIKFEKGTSLIELLVAITLFAFMIIVATQIFKMVIDGQRNALSAQNVQENIRYAMEKISKEIRMAKKSDDNCRVRFELFIPASNKVFNMFTDGNGNDQLYFKNQYDYCVVYYLADNRLKIMVRDSATGKIIADDSITPAKIKISNLKFSVVDDLINAFHSTQPYVTMVMDAQAVGLAIHKQEMKIQMTVSSRYYE